ncbi:hypothetical protein [Hyphomonas sp. BRH_c22]|uniref:hypothetical protein n=1 Tax=Hyphomonas sp. BRH_c22 TaxID=1629710 RepID=UPI0026258D94|nr:hypothetical protein [Hyphomonas sp. BRH_c22]
MEARAEDEPFSSLRGDPRMLGGEPLPDAWESKETLLDSACRLSAMRGFFGGNTDIHTYSCTLFEAGTMNPEADGELARSAYEAAVSTAEACLGDAWTTDTVTESAQYDVYGKTTFKPVVPEEQAGGFRADPIYVEMLFSRFTEGRGGKSGWEVTLQAHLWTAAPWQEIFWRSFAVWPIAGICSAYLGGFQMPLAIMRSAR